MTETVEQLREKRRAWIRRTHNPKLHKAEREMARNVIRLLDQKIKAAE